MTHLFQTLRATGRRLWSTDRPLMVVSAAMLPVLGACLVGLAVDPRLVGGAPTWLKPAKFAASTAIYSVTLAWVFTYLPEWRRTRRAASWTTAVVFVVEVGIIVAQAWRGTTSHFNVATPRDAGLFAVMGTAIVIQTLVSVAVAVAVWRQPIADAAMGVALRSGMVLTILGAASAGLMTSPTSAQLDTLRTTGRLATAGAHTVGAPDGGAGLPGVGWSRDHGDLRVPHFVGLHALQLLPLILAAARRRSRRGGSAGAMRVAAMSYLGLFLILLQQALRGEPLAAPGALTLALAVGWLTTSALGFVGLSGRRPVLPGATGAQVV
jgi:hypothetical protein